jgi:uncharacterized Zn finger protein
MCPREIDPYGTGDNWLTVINCDCQEPESSTIECPVCLDNLPKSHTMLKASDGELVCCKECLESHEDWIEDHPKPKALKSVFESFNEVFGVRV